MEAKRFIDKHLEYINRHRVILTELLQHKEPMLLKHPETGWNVAECIKHMLLASRPYLDRIEKELARSEAESTPHFKRGRLGKYFTYGMLPKPDGSVPNKMKTMPWFDPAKAKKYPEYDALSGRQLIQQLIQVYDQLGNALESARQLNLNKHKIISTLGPIIQFKLGDAFAFTLSHNARHLHQIKRIEKSILTSV